MFSHVSENFFPFRLVYGIPSALIWTADEQDECMKKKGEGLRGFISAQNSVSCVRLLVDMQKGTHYESVHVCEEETQSILV